MATTSDQGLAAAAGDPRRAARAAGARLRSVLSGGELPLPVDLGPDVHVEELGVGESYAAWLVRAEAAALVVRLPVRAVADLPCGMLDEVRAGKLIPAGIGSVPLQADETADNALHHPYLVSTYAPGQELPASDWTPSLLTRLAGLLARLHDPRYDGAGRIDEPGRPLDIVAEFDDGFAFWRGSHAEVIATPDNDSLAAGVRERLVALAPEFEGLKYSLIHSDLVTTNVVVDESGAPRLIDWEWARIGDVAKDLSLIGGLIHTGPWYASLSKDDIAKFVADYAADTGDDAARLLARRDAWELHERFQMSLHCQAMAVRPDAPARYADAAAKLRAGLARRVDELA